MFRKSLRLVSRLAVLQDGIAGGAYSQLLNCLQDRDGSRGALDLFERSFRAPFRAAKSDFERQGSLERYCGSPDSVEDVVVLMMKVYADHKRLEDVRFVFVLGVQSIARPSTYLLNTFLMCILRTDSFNEFEIDNIVELSRLRAIPRDAATELCLFILQLRMGQNVISLWPAIEKACREALTPRKSSSSSSPAKQAQISYLPQLLRDAMMALSCCHYDTAATMEAFRLVRLADSSLLTSTTLMQLLTHAAVNRAVSARDAVEVCSLIQWNQPATAVAASTGSDSASSGHSGLTERNAMRLLQKCFADKDSASATFVQQHIASVESLRISPFHDNFQLLAVGAHAASGNIAIAFDTLEDAVMDPLNTSPSTYSVDHRVASIFGSDCPLNALVRAVATSCSSPGGSESFRSMIEVLRARERQEKRVSTRSLNILLRATVMNSDVNACSHILKHTFEEFQQTPTMESLTAAAQCFSQSRDVKLMDQVIEQAKAPSKAFLAVQLEWAIGLGDCSRAVHAVQAHVETKARMDARLCVRLLKQLCVIGDVRSVQLVLEAMRTTDTPLPDPKVISLISAHLAKYGMQIKQVAPPNNA